MISRIEGVVESVQGSAAHVATGGGLTYEVLLPAHSAGHLASLIGQPVSLHTVHYLEGSSQSGNLIPRLAGFREAVDREFYGLFTSVKGIGPRKALRAMAMSSGQIAAAIADRDVKLLQSLPEIGRRMAETIIATLHGKVDRFVSASAYGPGRPAQATDASGEGGRDIPAARAALEILLQLGESRSIAVQWIDQVMVRSPGESDPSRIVHEALRIKTGQ